MKLTHGQIAFNRSVLGTPQLVRSIQTGRRGRQLRHAVVNVLAPDAPSSPPKKAVAQPAALAAELTEEAKHVSELEVEASYSQ